MKLSIIIPYHNAQPYTGELLECLDRQINPLGDDVTCNPDVEVLLIDDGSKVPYKPSYPWLKVMRQKNKGAGATRNKGIDKSSGEYIAFIDADDMVADTYVQRILDRIEQGFDVCDMSWRSLNKFGVWFDYCLQTEHDRLSNPSVCTRVFNRSYIGTIRFSELKDAAEDEDFSRRMGYLDPERMKGVRHTAITEYLYFYRTDAEGSNVKTYREGLRKTKRVVYYYDHVTADMTDVLEQIKANDIMNEVFLLTNQCDIPEIRRYAQVSTPFRLWTHVLKGEPYAGVDIITPPVRTQVVLYIGQINVIGGIETFVLNFAKKMNDFYDIVFVLGNGPDEQIRKIAQHIRVIKAARGRKIVCDTLIMLRILDDIPDFIVYNQAIQMCHACRTNPDWHIRQDVDHIINVSEASKKSFGEEASRGKVIHNLIDVQVKQSLILMSATRMPAPDKGGYETRIRTLCQMLDAEGIPFIWLNFSEGQMHDAPKGFHNMGMTDDVQIFMKRADYVVQLSDSEAFSYTLLEALTANVPVIVTPFESAGEMGIVDGENGYIVPFDMGFDVTRLLNVPQFEYIYDNDTIIKQWRKILGDTIPTRSYEPDRMVQVAVIMDYTDIELNRPLHVGEKLLMREDRAEYLSTQGFVSICSA